MVYQGLIGRLSHFFLLSDLALTRKRSKSHSRTPNENGIRPLWFNAPASLLHGVLRLGVCPEPRIREMRNQSQHKFAAWLGLVPKQMSTGDARTHQQAWELLSAHAVHAGRSRYFARTG